MSNLNSSFSSPNNRSTRSIGEFTPSYEKIFVPTNKETVWVYQKGRASTSLVDEDGDERTHFKGEWQVAGYSTGNNNNNNVGSTGGSHSSPSKNNQKGQHQHAKPDEVWIFRDDDPKGIDDRVLQNHPLRGKWGYSPSVTLKMHLLTKSMTMAVSSPSDMWFLPPHIKTYPDGFQPLGDWIRPIYHKDLSILSPGQSGFFTVGTGGPSDSGMGTSGRWKMYGFNDQSSTNTTTSTGGPTKVVVKKKKKPSTGGTTTAGQQQPPLPKSPAPIPPTKKKLVAVGGGTGTTLSSKPQGDPAVSTKNGVPPTTLKHKMVATAAGPSGGGMIVKKKIKMVAPSPDVLSPTSTTFQVHIRKPGGQVDATTTPTMFAVQVQPSYRVAQLKQKINRTRGIPLDIIHLSFQGTSIGETVVDEKKTLQSLNIHNDDVIDLAGIQLYVRTQKGKKFLLTNVDPEISVVALKGLVADKEGTAVPDQQLIFLNQLLEDGDNIAKYKIKNKSIVELQPAGTMSAPPPRMTKKMVVVRKGPATTASTPSSSSSTAPASIATSSSAPSPSTSTSTSSPTKKAVAKRAPSTGTTNNNSPSSFASPVAQNKRSVTTTTTPKVATTTPHSTKPKKSALKKTSTGAASNFGDSSSSLLSLTSPVTNTSLKKKWTVVLIQPDNSRVNVTVDTSDTLEDVQRKVAKTIGLPVHLLCLLNPQGGKALEVDDDVSPSSSFTLVDGAMLRRAPVISVTNSETGRTIRLTDVSTVKGLKRILEDRMGTRLEDQCLYSVDDPKQRVGGNATPPLEDDAPLDKDLNLRMDVADVPEEEEILCVTVKTSQGKSFGVEIEQGDEESTVRRKIAKKVGIPVQLLRLLREDDGKDIEKDTSMIKHGDVLVVGKPKIAIQTADGRILSLELEPYEASSSKVLKRRISKEVGIPASDLCLLKDARALDDEYLPSHGDILVIAPPKITIKTPDGDVFKLDVIPGECFADFKERIADEGRVPVSDLRLSVNNSAIEENYVPSYGDVLTIEPPRISVSTPEGRVFYVDVYPDDSAIDVRRKIAVEANISAAKLNLSLDGEEVDEDYLPSNGARLTIEPPASIVTIELPDGEKLEFEASPTTTIGEIKEILKDETGTSQSEQQLFRLGDHGGPLKNDTVIREDTYLRLEVPVSKRDEPTTIRITVNARDGQVYNLQIEQFETSANVLKRKIAKEAGIPVKGFRLSFDDIEVDKDYVAKNGDKLTLSPISKVAVKTTGGRIFNLDIQPDDTALDVREKISRETGIPEKSLLLAVNGEDLRRDSIPFHGDLVTIEPPSMTVVTLDGKSIKIGIEMSETHKFMRRKIARIVGVPLNELRLSRDDQEIAHDYMPCHDDVLSLIGTGSITVQLPDSSFSELPYSPKMTIADLKGLLQDESGIKPADQLVIASEGNDFKEDGAFVDEKLAYRMEIVKEPFTITICTPDEQIMTLDVSSCKCARDVREKVAEAVGVPLMELRLSKDEVDIDELYMPSHGEYLTVQPPTVTVRLPDGSDLELSASPTTTIADIMEALEDELGIGITDQRLLDQETGEVQLKDMPIERSMNLLLEVAEKSFTITVNTPDDQVFGLEISPTDSRKEVLAKIAEEIGIPVDEVRLSKDDKELGEDYMPSNGDEVSVEPPMITVKLPNGSALELSALPTTTMRDLKETLEDEIGVSANDQQLYSMTDEMEMDDRSLVKHLMELRLEVAADRKVESSEVSKTIAIKTRNGDKFSIELALNATLREVKNKVAETIGIPLEELRLHSDEDEDEEELDDAFVPSCGTVLSVGAPTVKVRLLNGDEVELEAMESTTIGDVKETLEEETGIPASRLFLFFLDSGGNPLDDEMLIKNDLHLQLEELIEVKVKDVAGIEFSLGLSPRKAYADVKDAIASKTSIPSCELRLSMSGEDLDTNYFPSTGDVLTIESPRITVELPDGTRVRILMLPTNTIADLKASIEQQYGIPIDSQKITFFQDESGLADDTLLSLSKFFDGNVLRVQPEITEVTVITHDGRSLIMKMDPKDTKNDVRYKIGREIGIPTQDLRLSKDGAPLDRKYKPKNGDVLTVEGQRIRVELPDGSKIDLSVMPTQLLGEVKDAIEKMSGISKTDQRLFFANGKAELDDTKAVSKYGLDESLVLQVRLPDRPPSVKVELSDGRKLMMDIDQGKTLGHLKADLAGVLGLPVGILDLNGKSLKDLDDSKTLKELGVRVKDDDELHVGPTFVDTTLPDGSRIRFEAAPTMTVMDLKAFVASRMSNASQSDLRVLSAGQLDPLDDATPFASLDFTKGLRLEMEPINATVKLPGIADSVSVELQRDEKIGELKEKLAREHNLDARDVFLCQDGIELDDSQTIGESSVMQDCKLEMKIFQFQVMIMNSSVGEVLTIDDMPDAATIGNLKERLTKEKGIIVGSQLLILDDTLLEEDEKSLRECGVKHMSVLILDKATENEIQISIEHWNGDVFTVEARPSDSIGSIKERVAVLTKLTPEQQILTYEDVPLERGAILHERGIGDRFELKLKQPQIYVTLPTGESHSVSIEPDYTINRVKELLAPVTLLDVEDQILIKGQQPVGNGSTLVDCGVEIGDTLVLEQFSVSVLCWSGDVIELVGVRSKDTVDKVKEILLEKKSVPKEKQRLMRGGTALEDEKTTLAGYGVQHKDTLLLDNPDKIGTAPSSPRKGKSPFSFLQKATNLLASPKAKNIAEKEAGDKSEANGVGSNDQELVSITVITPELQSINLEMDPNISASECRKKIAEGVGVPLDELRLSKFGEAIDEAYTPSHGEVLTVEPLPTVTVRLPDGSKLELSVSPTTTIEELKECLEDETGISTGDQKLFVKKGADGDEDEMRDDSIICDDIELRLVGLDDEGSQEEESDDDNEEVEEGVVEYDEVTAAATIVNDGGADGNDGNSDEEDTLLGSDDGHLLSSPKRKFNVGTAKEYKSKPLEIHIQESNGTQHTFHFHKEATVAELKYKLPSHAANAENMSDLCVLSNGKELDADSTLEECGVTGGEVLVLEAYSLQIMHFMSAVLPFDTVSRLDTVGAVKEKLAMQQSIPKHQQKLTVQGGTTVLDDNKKTLKEYGIKHKTVLILQEDTGRDEGKAKAPPSPREQDSDERAKNLDDRIAKIKERAEARRMAREASGR